MGEQPAEPRRKPAPERTKLTVALVSKAQPPGEGERWIWDLEVKGLALRIRASGHKSFLFRYRTFARWLQDGQPREGWRQKWVQVGEWGKQTLEEARQRAREVIGEVAQEKDPSAEKRRRRDTLPTAWTFQDAADRFMREHGPKLKETTRREYQRQLKTVLLPALGKRDLRSITFEEMEKVHQGLKPILSNRIHALASSIFRACERWRLMDPRSNPTFGHVKHRESSRERFMSGAELQALGKALDEILASEDAEPVERRAALVVQALLFSGMRLSEVLTLEWKWVDRKAALIRLPDSKAGAAVVDINPWLDGVFERARKLQKLGSPLVFPGRTGGPIRGMWGLWAAILEKAKLIPPQPKGQEKAPRPLPVHLHDLRRTAATLGVSDAGLTSKAVGGVLRHKTAAITEVYARLAGEARKDANTKMADAVAKRLGAEEA